jgi:hypothetical protein
LIADGTTLGPPLVDESSIDAAVNSISGADWTVSPNGRARNAKRILHAALLRDLARLTSAAIGRRLGLSASRVTDALIAHRELIHDDPLYVAVLDRVAQQAIRRCHGRGSARVKATA